MKRDLLMNRRSENANSGSIEIWESTGGERVSGDGCEGFGEDGI